MAKRMTGMISVRLHNELIEKLKKKHLKKKKILEKNDPELNYTFQDYLRELFKKDLEDDKG